MHRKSQRALKGTLASCCQSVSSTLLLARNRRWVSRSRGRGSGSVLQWPGERPVFKDGVVKGVLLVLLAVAVLALCFHQAVVLLGQALVLAHVGKLVSGRELLEIH